MLEFVSFDRSLLLHFPEFVLPGFICSAKPNSQQLRHVNCFDWKAGQPWLTLFVCSLDFFISRAREIKQQIMCFYTLQIIPCNQRLSYYSA